MNNIKKYVALINSVYRGDIDTIISEGAADTILKQAFDSVSNKVPEDSEKDVTVVINTVKKLWNETKTRNSYGKMPNSWKNFLAHVLRSNLYDTLEEYMELPKRAKSRKRYPPFYKVFTDLEHYSGLDYNPIQTFDPMGSPDPLTALKELEDEYKELIQNKYIVPTGAEKVIKDFGEYAWFDLGKGYCADEGAAMGHCGNTGADANDTILSLRKKVKVGNEIVHYPYATFILNNGFLGEMKGRGNEKPSEKYHKYIFELLKLPIIKGIIGHGWLPENNFTLSDLPNEWVDELRKVKGDEFVDNEGDLLQRVRHSIDVFQQGEISAEKLVSEINESLERIFPNDDTSDYEVRYKNNRFCIYKPDVSDIWEIKVLSRGEGIDLDELTIDDYGQLLEDKFVGKFRNSVIRYILQVYSQDIREEFSLDDEDDINDTVDNELHHVIDNIATGVRSALDSLYILSHEYGTENQIVSAAKSAIDELCESLYLDNISVLDFIEGEDYLYIKNNDIWGYIKNIYDRDMTSESISDRFEIESPYYGYTDFDDSVFDDMSRVHDVFSENDVDLDFFEE